MDRTRGDGETIARAEAWAESLTDTEYTDAVATLVENLWPDYADAGDDWQDTLRAWLEADRTTDEDGTDDGGNADPDRDDDAPDVDFTDLPLTSN